MNYPLYEYSLCIALPLMIFFGVYFLLAPTPDRAIFANYLRSRRIMGAAILLLAANYAVHFFFGIRFHNVNAAILMNLSTYFLCYWLFSSALTTLLDRFYVTGRRFAFHLAAWMLFTLLSAFILLGLHSGPTQKAGLTVMAAWLVCYGIRLARRLIRAYRRAVRLFADTHSDDIGAYIRWLSIFTYWAVIFGVGCGLLTFLPDRYVFVWILSSVPFYIYLFHCYQSYLLFYERVEHAMESEIASEDEILSDAGTESEPEPEMPSHLTEIAGKIREWIATRDSRSRNWPTPCIPTAPTFRDTSRRPTTFRSATGSLTCGWNMPSGACSGTPSRTSPKSPRSRASFRPAISPGSSRKRRVYPRPDGASLTSKTIRFRDIPPTPGAGASCLNNNFSCLNDNFHLPKRQFLA